MLGQSWEGDKFEDDDLQEKLKFNHLHGTGPKTKNSLLK